MHCRHARKKGSTRLQGRGPSPEPPAAGPAAPVKVTAARRDGRDEAHKPLRHAKSTADMHGRRAVLACRAAGRPRTPRPQARRPQSRCQPHVVTDEMRPTNHSGMPSALLTCTGDVQYSPAGPRADPGPPGRRPGSPSRGDSRTS